jgi:hypothetical protein
MVAVIAAMGGEIEGDRKPLLTLLQRLPIKGIGFPGGRKARILADGPGAVGIHGGAHATRERLDTRHFAIIAEIDGLHRYAAIVPVQRGKRGIAEFLLGEFFPFFLVS